jgi:hypothetical protein
MYILDFMKNCREGLKLCAFDGHISPVVVTVMSPLDMAV